MEMGSRMNGGDEVEDRDSESEEDIQVDRSDINPSIYLQIPDDDLAGSTQGAEGVLRTREDLYGMYLSDKKLRRADQNRAFNKWARMRAQAILKVEKLADLM